jgi:hypothetical protein
MEKLKLEVTIVVTEKVALKKDLASELSHFKRGYIL